MYCNTLILFFNCHNKLHSVKHYEMKFKRCKKIYFALNCKANLFKNILDIRTEI